MSLLKYFEPADWLNGEFKYNITYFFKIDHNLCLIKKGLILNDYSNIAIAIAKDPKK